MKGSERTTVVVIGIDYSGLGLWCLAPLLTIFLLYRDGQFYCYKKPELRPAQVADTRSHIMLYTSP